MSVYYGVKFLLLGICIPDVTLWFILFSPWSVDDVPIGFDVVPVLFAEVDAVVFNLFASSHGCYGEVDFWSHFFKASCNGGLFCDDVDEVPA